MALRMGSVLAYSNYPSLPDSLIMYTQVLVHSLMLSEAALSPNLEIDTVGSVLGIDARVVRAEDCQPLLHASPGSHQKETGLRSVVSS
jgi:hypothetical protein